MATWEIRDEHLFLNSIEGRFRLLGTEPVPHDLFTGVLRVPRGVRLDEHIVGPEPIYSEELRIQVEGGRVAGAQIYERSWNGYRYTTAIPPG